jgi:hypothetical protein
LDKKTIRSIDASCVKLKNRCPKRSGEKKRVHDGLGFDSHPPSVVGGVTVYEIAEELL